MSAAAATVSVVYKRLLLWQKPLALVNDLLGLADRHDVCGIQIFVLRRLGHEMHRLLDEFLPLDVALTAWFARRGCFTVIVECL